MRSSPPRNAEQQRASADAEDIQQIMTRHKAAITIRPYLHAIVSSSLPSSHHCATAAAAVARTTTTTTNKTEI
jgi:hypothetical protein